MRCLTGVKQRIHFKIATLTYQTLQSGSPLYLSSHINLNTPSRLLRSSSHNLLHVPFTTTAIGRKPSILQLQQFGIPSHSVSGNYHLLAHSNVISKLIYLPSPASPFSHPATLAPPNPACLNLCAIQIL